MAEGLARHMRGPASRPSSAGEYFVQSQGILVELRAKVTKETLDTFGPAKESQELKKKAVCLFFGGG